MVSRSEARRCWHMTAVYLSRQLPAPVRRALRQSVGAW